MPPWNDWIKEVVGVLTLPLMFPLMLQQRISILYGLSALLIAYILYQTNHVEDKKDSSLRAFLKYCFPKKIYAHQSALADYIFFLFSRQVLIWLIVPISIQSGWVRGGVLAILNAIGVSSPQFSVSGLWMNIGYTLAILLAFDLGLFLSHWMMHKVPKLWELHKVHHSAEVLTPITVYRMHPLDDLITISTVALLTGAMDACFSFFFLRMPIEVLLFGLNAILFCHYLLGYNLRHSHIWFSYGPFWSRVFVSPAQHQIHHSVEERHLDKNFGFIFSFWDGLFGSLYVPKAREYFKLGLHSGASQEYHNAFKLFIMPIVRVLKKNDSVKK